MRPPPVFLRSLLLPAALAGVASGTGLAAELSVEVRDGEGIGISEAVVYAIPLDGAAQESARSDAIMDQRDRKFVPHVLPVQAGTRVSFPNSDDVRHQVYSFSAAKRFQIPLYEGKPPNPIVFDRPGAVALGCSIHDRMRAYIVVVDTPYFATTVDGHAELDLPAGSYRVHVWTSDRRTISPRAVELSAGANERIELVAGR